MKTIKENIKIENRSGMWFVNGKRFADCVAWERRYLLDIISRAKFKLRVPVK